MAKNIDYAKVKAMAQSILECIGEYDEGENPSLPKQKEDIDDGGQDELESLSPAADCGDDRAKDPEEKKKKKDSSLAMMSTMLASKFKKY
jgi:hypothetical protein